MNTGKTIAAISTPYGKGGIAVIRISGDEAFGIAGKIFVPKNISFADVQLRRAVFGSIIYQNNIIDKGLVVLFPSESSYTGEPVAEISCHGGILVTSLVLEAALSAGALLADPGEFTFRAFINGRISLSQAEDVGDIIDAQSIDKLCLAVKNSGGFLEERILSLRERLLKIISSAYAYIDYPDEDLTDISPSEMLEEMTSLKKQLDELASTYHTGRAVCEGIPCVILGRPNTGKSSLLNLLCGERRAIVTPVAGTTRDVIEETVSLGKVILRLSDTAGIRESDDYVEKIGVESAWEKYDSSHLVFLVFDSSQALTGDDFSLISSLSEKKSGREIIPILNKIDLDTKIDAEYIERALGRTVLMSSLTGIGKDELMLRVDNLYKTSLIGSDTAIVTRARLHAAIKNASEHIEEAINSIKKGFTQDVASLSLESALCILDGERANTTPDKIIHDIFSRFCIGK